MDDESIQKLRPIPIEDPDHIETYDITCCLCERMWIVSSQEILMYEAFKKTDNSVKKVRICFECGTEKVTKDLIRANECNDFRNENAWMKCKVLISDFRCCYCGDSCDVNFKVTDGYIGKLPFVRFAFIKNHKFCFLCWENVKSGAPDAKGRIRLDPKQCRPNHDSDSETSDIELSEEQFAK